jgi:hypothetical protein
MDAVALISTVVGVVLIAIALNDVFQTLLRPTGTGRLAHLVFRMAWAIRRSRRYTASGPLTILVVIGLWVGLVAVGWALIYLPHVPEGFAYSGIDASAYHPFAEALTMSLVALTTLGLGDVVPAHPVLRVLSPLEALTGFALLTASVSWFMQLYPALARRRSFGLHIESLREAQVVERWSELSDSRAAETLSAVTAALAGVTADLVQNSEIFYFTDHTQRMSAPRAMEYVLELRDAASASRSPDVQAEGRILAAMVDELVRLLKTQYPHVRGESTEEVVTDVATAHGHRWSPQ